MYVYLKTRSGILYFCIGDGRVILYAVTVVAYVISSSVKTLRMAPNQTRNVISTDPLLYSVISVAVLDEILNLL